MELLDHLALGFATAATAYNLAFCFIGALLGTLIGVLPGVGPLATIAMLLPITFAMAPETSLIMLAGIYYGSQYGGSTTAILLNLPGESSSAVTAIDGYRMAIDGRAGPALAAAAIGSFFAGTVATVIIAVFAIPLTELALEFGPVDYCSLILLGLVASIALARGSVVKAIAMIVLGLLFGQVGTDVFSGQQRFTLGFEGLADGVSLVALSVGMFGISEVLLNLRNDSERSVLVRKLSSIMPRRDDLKAIFMPIMRGTFLGSALGVLPGGGSIIASFAAYALEKKLSRTPERFGHGAIEGVAAPESANNAAAQTSFIPMLTLGIPGNGVMALMAGAMMIQGINPGPDVAALQPRLFWGLIASMWLGNLMLLVINLPLVGLWAKMLTIPYRALFPAIVVFATIGVYSVNSSTTDLVMLAAFGMLGVLLVEFGFEPAPLLLGFVLGPMLEENFRRAMLLSRGDPLVFFQHPISASLLFVAVVILVLITLPSLGRRRNQVFVEDNA